MSEDVNVLSPEKGAPEPLGDEDLQGLANRYASRWCTCISEATSLTTEQLISFIKSETRAKLLKHEGEEVVRKGSESVGTGIEHWIFSFPDGLCRPDKEGKPNKNDPVNLCVSRFKHTPRATAQNILDTIMRIASFEDVSPCVIVDKIRNPLRGAVSTRRPVSELVKPTEKGAE